MDAEKKSSIKRKIEAAGAGIPVEHQKLLLGGIAQIMVGDKRDNLEYGTCGWASNTGLAVMTAEQGAKPHIPRESPHRLDNKGTMTEGWSAKKDTKA